MNKRIVKVMKLTRLLILTLLISKALYSCVFMPPVLPPVFFTPATLPADYPMPPTPSTEHLRIVTLDPKQLSGRFSFTLFDDTPYIALVDRVEEQGKGNFVWYGHVAGQQESQIKVTVHDQVISGVIELHNVRYELERLHDNVYALYERPMAA